MPARAQSQSSAQLLARGESEYHAGRYGAAADALRKAADALLSNEAQNRYVSEGVLPELPQIEESLVYLALTYGKLGHSEDARDTVLRLITAERISPVYAELALQRDRTDFETLAKTLVPGIELPRDRGTAVNAPVATTSPERVVMFRLIELRAAEQRAQIERQAAARVANLKNDVEPNVVAHPPKPVAPAVRSAAAPPPKSTRAHYDEMARQFARSANGKFTIQVEIACEPSSIAGAIAAGGDSVWFVPIAYRGRPCYRVFWGHSATAGEAQRAIAAMPATLRNAGAVVVREPLP